LLKMALNTKNHLITKTGQENQTSCKQEYIYPLFLFSRLLLFFNITMNHVVKLYVIILMPFFNLILLCVLSFFVAYNWACS
jgi:hypothetical protein